VAKVSGDAQTGTVGSTLPQPLVVRVTDAHNNPTPGVAVTFAVTSGGGSVTTASAATDAQGLASTTQATLTEEFLLTSTSIDAFFIMLDAAGNPVAYDDDGAGGNNSSIRLIAPAGQYILGASSFGAGQTGP
jgi:flagellar hook protein FlgE